MLKPKKPSQPLPESTIQRKVRLRYEKNGWLVVKIIQCTLNGWPDLQAHKVGITVFIECKATGAQLSNLQKFRHKQLREKGFTVLTIDQI